MCEICDTPFQFASRLAYRRQDLHPQGALTEHRCNHCEKLYDTAKALKQHLKRSHAGKGQRKLLQCPIFGCFEKYGDSAGLEKHKKSKHAGVTF